MYLDLLKAYLNKIKLENKMVKLEEQMKRERVVAKGWKVQVKKLVDELAAQESKAGDKKATKKMREDKDKQIEALQKKINLFVKNHPQIEEILVIQNKHDALKDEVLDLKAKLLQVTYKKDQLFQEKEELMRKVQLR